MSEVSVIIPAYNCGPYILDCVNSVLKQTFNDYEMIIIDDGSADNTKELLGPFLNNKKIDYIYQDNRGLPGARNAGIRRANGNYILCLDADDELAPDAIQKLFESARNNNAQWVISDIYRVENNVTEVQKAVLPSQNPLIDLLSHKTYFRSCFYSKNCLLHLDMYDESQKCYEDWELYVRLFESKAVYSYVPEPLYIYKIRKHSITKQRTFKKNLSFTEKIYKKHYKRMADAGAVNMHHLYAEVMWQLASDYLFKAGSLTGMLRCFNESLKYDSSVFKGYLAKKSGINKKLHGVSQEKS